MEELIGRHASVVRRVLPGTPPQLHELRDDVVLARPGQAEPGGVSVLLRIVVEMVEAGVPGARATCGFGIDTIEVRDDRVDRLVQAVEIETVESDARGLCPGFTRDAAGQSASTATAVKPRSAISLRVMIARSR